jgi:hypothetical protein
MNKRNLKQLNYEKRNNACVNYYAICALVLVNYFFGLYE